MPLRKLPPSRPPSALGMTPIPICRGRLQQFGLFDERPTSVLLHALTVRLKHSLFVLVGRVVSGWSANWKLPRICNWTPLRYVVIRSIAKS
jgi:hypothetical protein